MKKIIKSERVPIKLWLNDVDEITLNQAKNLANLPFAFKWICLMPDAHPGYGMPIGGILATKDYIVPNAVGVDIGCGMVASKTSLTDISQEILKKIMSEIRKKIPVGFTHHKEKQEWMGFDKAPKVKIVQQELANAKYQLGTLGGGNHFIEILKGDDNHIWIMLHSGSRNFGFKTAEYFHKKALQLRTRYSENDVNEDLSCLLFNSKTGQEYFVAMNFCLSFASANRDLIMKQIQEIFEKETRCHFEPTISSHHNYVALEKHFGEEVFVHRKGAIKVTFGQIGIIPGSMGTPSYIVEGLGNEESFSSASHGAGRRLGRHQAIKSLKLEEEQEKMEGVLGAPRTANELQEAPGAYKNIDQVMKNQTDLVKVKIKLLPLAVITGN